MYDLSHIHFVELAPSASLNVMPIDPVSNNAQSQSMPTSTSSNQLSFDMRTGESEEQTLHNRNLTVNAAHDLSYLEGLSSRQYDAENNNPEEDGNEGIEMEEEEEMDTRMPLNYSVGRGRSSRFRRNPSRGRGYRLNDSTTTAIHPIPTQPEIGNASSSFGQGRREQDRQVRFPRSHQGRDGFRLDGNSSSHSRDEFMDIDDESGSEYDNSDDDFDMAPDEGVRRGDRRSVPFPFYGRGHRLGAAGSSTENSSNLLSPNLPLRSSLPEILSRHAGASVSNGGGDSGHHDDDDDDDNGDDGDWSRRNAARNFPAKKRKFSAKQHLSKLSDICIHEAASKI